jgi:asparagine synthase (glutamine-hydrolysing)
MCGICGFIDFTSQSDRAVLNEMVSTLHHRGPDDNGCEVHSLSQASVGLGHTRLSILDLSPAGHQPMQYNHLSIVLNGEIYNFKEIRRDLVQLGHTFKSESDTEVILHAFDEWGAPCVSKFIGMFAFVIFNRKTLEVSFVRDRAGVKPLFYYWRDGLFLFASELKAFHAHRSFTKRLNVNAVHQYMDFGYVPSPYCIFEDCCKLEPGHILTFSVGRREFTITKYWDVRDYYCLPSLRLSYDEAKEQLEKLLVSAFAYRMVSDVPVGVFLSGGYDSTAVAAVLQRNSGERLKTFTIGSGGGSNEAPFAKEIARYIGTDHTEYYCTTKEAQDIIPTLPYFYDEPFADDSAIPTMLVSRLARQDVTVALSADAGDEIFAGYANYRTFSNNVGLIDKIPVRLRKTLSWLSGLGAVAVPDNALRHKVETLSQILTHEEKHIPQVLLRRYLTLSKTAKRKLFNSSEVHQDTVYDDDFSLFKDRLSIALGTDYIMYLQNTILTKVDRATMSVSLEGREPFLDHRIIEFAAQLPSTYKYGHTTKMILKDIVYKYVPKKLMDRPKTGFDVPIDLWLRTSLSYLLEENLHPRKIEESGVFQSPYIQGLRKKFMRGQLQDATLIWKLLQFQLWYNQWMR